MNERIVVDLFSEDRAHEELLKPLLARIAGEENAHVSVRVRNARGGHGRAIDEFKLYQSLVVGGFAGATSPDVVVVAIDGNCASFAAKRNEIQKAVDPVFKSNIVAACPDPHVERWYLADPDSFQAVVGHRPVLGGKKCERNHYKRLLLESVRQAGHPITLGGVEFAAELVQAMDFYRAGKNDHSLDAFVGDLRGVLRQLRNA